ncbi:DoxX family membrane protein [Brachybacterium halotolerans subsp. kimchii]|uniref:DoxX family membrane protein n=1 Tax=Brachybacterium halotolerans TaxID=2795215 RepID=UPI001E318FFC|nr:DoxX family membrane protein [Brachybacterium halotolerans]UEJ82388.1 DoxX family membrane protein [Brachybacterium halotolerans subsp. kimchii]
MAFSLSNTILRGVTGAYILNSGIGKLGLPEEAATGLQQMASQGIPQVESLSPKQFGWLVSLGEIAVGSALLLPIVPTRVAGLSLGAFSAGMLSMYFRNPEMTQDDGIRPSHAGTPLSKDLWLAAIALALLVRGAGSKKVKVKGVAKD